MSKLLPTPESSFVLDHYKDDMEVVDLVQGAGIVEEGYDQEDVDVVQRAVAQEYDDLLEQVEGQKYGKEDGNLVGAGEHGYEEDEEEVDLEQAPREQEMTHSLAEVIEGDILQEKPINTTKFVATSIKVDGRNNVPPEGTALSREDVFYGQDSIRIYNEEPLEQDKLMLEVLKGTGMKNMLNDATNNMDIYKQKPVVEEKQLKEVVEGDATMIELNVNDINEPGSGYSYQARVYDAKNGFALLKEKSDEMERGLLMMSYMDGEARNETQEQSISQGNDNYACQSVKKKQKKIIEHSHEGGYKADTANYLQVDDLLSVKGTEARNERLIIEDMNEKPVIELRQVIVSVHRGKIAPEHKSEDVKECSKSQKIVLVAKKVIEEIVGDPNSVVECKNALGDMNLARREIADECGLDLFDYRAGDHDSYNDFNISQGIVLVPKKSHMIDFLVGTFFKQLNNKVVTYVLRLLRKCDLNFVV